MEDFAVTEDGSGPNPKDVRNIAKPPTSNDIDAIEKIAGLICPRAAKNKIAEADIDAHS